MPAKCTVFSVCLAPPKLEIHVFTPPIKSRTCDRKRRENNEQPSVRNVLTPQANLANQATPRTAWYSLAKKTPLQTQTVILRMSSFPMQRDALAFCVFNEMLSLSFDAPLECAFCSVASLRQRDALAYDFHAPLPSETLSRMVSYFPRRGETLSLALNPVAY